MLRLILIIGMSIPCWTAGVQCNEDSHCADDYYCELDYSCRKCLRCDEDFKRAPPPVPTACVKSMVECGACLELKGRGSNNDCGINAISTTPGASESKEIRLPVYAWVLLVLIVAVVIGGVTLIPWINRATYATVPRSESQIPPGTSDHPENAWSSPPAYNTIVDIPRPNNEDTALYVKSETFKPLDESRESADRQATQPFSPPNYVRHPLPSPVFTHDDQVAISNTEEQSSVDGVIAVRIQPTPTAGDALPIQPSRNMDLEGCPDIASSRNNQSMESSLPTGSTESARGGPPVVVVNNNVHLQSVSLSGASIFLPQPSNHLERR